MIYMPETNTMLTIAEARASEQNTANVHLLTEAELAARRGGVVPIPFEVPDGYVATGNQRVELIDGEYREMLDVVSVAEHEAANEAQRLILEAEQAAEAIKAAAERKAAMASKLTPGIVGLAMAYRMTLRAMFPPRLTEDMPAEVNRQITQDVVVGTLMQLPQEQYDAKTADMLKLAFEQLSAIAGDGTTWTFFETVGDLIPMGGV